MRIVEPTSKERTPLTIEFQPNEIDMLFTIVGGVGGKGPLREFATNFYYLLKNNPQSPASTQYERCKRQSMQVDNSL